MKLRNSFRAQLLKLIKLMKEKSRTISLSQDHNYSQVSTMQHNFPIKNNSNNFNSINTALALSSLTNHNVNSQRESKIYGKYMNRESKVPIPLTNKENLSQVSKNLEILSKPKVVNTEGEKNQFQFFHTLGKILYNKRVDPKNGEIRPMKKHEMQGPKMPKSYFNIQELISEMNFEPAKFNEFLIERSFNHFKDIKELAQACDTFSYTNTFSSHTFSSKFTYESKATTMTNYQTLLNSMACMCLNKSQYRDDSDTNSDW